MAATTAQSASATRSTTLPAWADMFDAARAAAQRPTGKGAVDVARPDNGPALAAIGNDVAQAIPRDRIDINDLAVPGAARDQMIAYMAQITGRSVDDLTAAAAKGTLTISATAVATKAWHGVIARLSPEARSAYRASIQDDSAGAPQLDAVNIDAIAQQADPSAGGSVGRYADALTSTAARYQAQGTPYTFTGSWGTDRVTHDVGDYVGWLYQAVGRQAQRKAQAVLH